MKRIVVSHIKPLVDWNIGDTYYVASNEEDPDISGYSIDVFKFVMNEAFDDSDFYFDCIAFKDVESEIENGRAWAAIGGMTISSVRMQAGF